MPGSRGGLAFSPPVSPPSVHSASSRVFIDKLDQFYSGKASANDKMSTSAATLGKKNYPAGPSSTLKYQSPQEKKNSSSPPMKDHIQGSPQYWGGQRVSANPSVVTTAFRELKERAKAMEDEIEIYKTESADIKDKIAAYEEKRHALSSKRGEAQLRHTEQLFAMRATHNALRSDVAEWDVRLLHLDNETRTIQVDMTHNRQLQSSLEDDLVQLRSTLQHLRSGNDDRHRELNAAFDKGDKLQKQIDAFPPKHSLQRERLACAVHATEDQVAELQAQILQQQQQFAAVVRYLKMLVTVNDEICSTILAREEARDRVLRLSGRVRLPYDPYSGTGGAAPREALTPSQRSRVSQAAPVVQVDELMQRAREVSHRLTLAQTGRLLEEEGLWEAELEEAPAHMEDDERNDEEERQGENDATVSFSDALGVLSRRASHHALESQAEVARQHARLLSQAASGSTLVPMSTEPVSKANAQRSRSAHGIHGKGAAQELQELHVRSAGKAYRQAVSEMTEAFTPAAADGRTALVARHERPSSSPNIRIAQGPPGSPPQGLGLALGASYGYGYDAAAHAGMAFASGAGAAAKRRDVGKPLIATNTGSSAYSQHGRSSKDTSNGSLKYPVAVLPDELPLPTYREPEKRPRSQVAAWMPSGKSFSTISNNIIANKSKVYRSAKVASVNVPLNHYNKLHLNQL